MSPAFSSNRQAMFFLAMISTIMLLPFVVPPSALAPRSEIYSSIPWRFGGHPYFKKTIFEEKKDIDIAFLGSSRIWCGIDPVHVKEQLTQSLGRESEVTTLGWNTAGFDAVFFIAEDLLKHRNVKVLVVNDEYNPEIGGKKPHRLASRWYRTQDNNQALAELSWPDQFSYEASAILGMPRNLIGTLRPNLGERKSASSRFSPQSLYQCPDPELRLGALRVAKGFGDSVSGFRPFSPQNDVNPEEAVTYSTKTHEMFDARVPDPPPLQMHFAKRLAELAKRHGSTLVFLHLPSTHDSSTKKIRESAVWPSVLTGDVKFIGFAPETFFRGIPKSDIPLLFSDSMHLNRNGQDYLTRLITPKLIECYHEIQHQ